MANNGVTFVVIPGGPGLSPAYMRPWARAAARALGARVAEIDYGVFAGKSAVSGAKRFDVGLSTASVKLGKLTRGRIVLIGHSFGARIALELLRKYPSCADAAILLNCPAEFAPSRSYLRRKKRIDLPASITDERSFAVYWRAILPLFFRRAPQSAWFAVLARGTCWTRTSWLDSVITGEPKKLRRGAAPLLFVNGSNDERFPRSNGARLKKLFPSAAHASIQGSGHFPMLENPRALTSKITGFLSS